MAGLLDPIRTDCKFVRRSGPVVLVQEQKLDIVMDVDMYTHVLSFASIYWFEVAKYIYVLQVIIEDFEDIGNSVLGFCILTI